MSTLQQIIAIMFLITGVGTMTMRNLILIFKGYSDKSIDRIISLNIAPIFWILASIAVSLINIGAK